VIAQSCGTECRAELLRGSARPAAGASRRRSGVGRRRGRGVPSRAGRRGTWDASAAKERAAPGSRRFGSALPAAGSSRRRPRVLTAARRGAPSRDHGTKAREWKLRVTRLRRRRTSTRCRGSRPHRRRGRLPARRERVWRRPGAVRARERTEKGAGVEMPGRLSSVQDGQRCRGSRADADQSGGARRRAAESTAAPAARPRAGGRCLGSLRRLRRRRGAARHRASARPDDAIGE
jgi:hypothetical protein